MVVAVAVCAHSVVGVDGADDDFGVAEAVAADEVAVDEVSEDEDGDDDPAVVDPQPTMASDRVTAAATTRIFMTSSEKAVAQREAEG